MIAECPGHRVASVKKTEHPRVFLHTCRCAMMCMARLFDDNTTWKYTWWHSSPITLKRDAGISLA